MEQYRDLVLALRTLEIDGTRPAIAHASLSSFGWVKGGAPAVVGALFEHFDSLIMPTFTYKTMVIPETGPPYNGIDYGKYPDSNKMAQFFHPDMPADGQMGIIPETLRQHHTAARSMHPILSFSGVNAEEVLESQRISDPLAPIATLMEQDAWVLLLGVGHTANTSIHLGERLAGRKSFVRWALVPDLVVECPGFPPCSDGFDKVARLLHGVVRKITVGKAAVQAMRVVDLVQIVRGLVKSDPLALLCDKPQCTRCNAVRAEVWSRGEGELETPN